jgi:hypothetical protein
VAGKHLRKQSEAVAEQLERVYCPGCRNAGVVPVDVETSPGETEESRQWLVRYRCHGCGWIGRCTRLHSSHNLTCLAWAAFLARQWPQIFGDPQSTSQFPTLSLPGSVRKVEVMASRANRGQPLYHAADARRTRYDKVAQTLVPERNGRTVTPTAFQVVGDPEDDDMEAPLPGPELMLAHLARHGVQVGQPGAPVCSECSWPYRDADGRCRWCGSKQKPRSLNNGQNQASRA